MCKAWGTGVPEKLLRVMLSLYQFFKNGLRPQKTVEVQLLSWSWKLSQTA